jgi:hypothetical protein
MHVNLRFSQQWLCKLAVSWNVISCDLLEVNRHYRGNKFSVTFYIFHMDLTYPIESPGSPVSIVTRATAGHSGVRFLARVISLFSKTPGPSLVSFDRGKDGGARTWPLTCNLPSVKVNGTSTSPPLVCFRGLYGDNGILSPTSNHGF